MKWILLVLLLASSQLAFAFPEAPFDALKKSDEFFREKGFAFSGYDFEGIVQLSNCSGAIVRFSGQPITAKALVLTNGHCLGGRFLRPGQVITNRRVRRRMRVFNRVKRRIRIRATRILYGTMTNTDAAIYELNQTYEQLERKGVRAFDFSARRPIVKTPIDIVSGYWNRGYSCHIDAFIYQLREARWTFTDSIRYSSTGCNTIGGTSGSPIIKKGTRLVIGVNNTGNESGRRCTMNNPCEVDREGNVKVRYKASYGQQTYQFYSCLRPDFSIDVTMRGCQLPKGR